MIKYATIALALASVGLSVALWWQSDTLAGLRVVSASQKRSITALKEQADQAREAAEVAKATAEREREKAEKYDRLREALIEGNQDVEIPDEFADWLVDLLGPRWMRAGTDH